MMKHKAKQSKTREFRKIFLGLWQWLNKPHDSLQEMITRQQSAVFSSMVLIIFPLIILVGIVGIPLIEKNPKLWQSSTFYPALLASIISVLAYFINRSRYYQLAISAYSFVFVVSPLWVIIRNPAIHLFPIGLLSLGGVMMNQMLRTNKPVSWISAALPPLFFLILPIEYSHLSLPDVIPSFALLITLTILLLTSNVYQNLLFE